MCLLCYGSRIFLFLVHWWAPLSPSKFTPRKPFFSSLLPPSCPEIAGHSFPCVPSKATQTPLLPFPLYLSASLSLYHETRIHVSYTLKFPKPRKFLNFSWTLQKVLSMKDVKRALNLKNSHLEKKFVYLCMVTDGN